MQAFILGLLALAVVLVLVNRFTTASPARLARNIKRGVGAAMIAVAVLLAVRGVAALSMPAAMLGLWLLGDGFGLASRRTTRSSGQTSRVVTDHLEMELEHDTGRISGTVTRGLFSGRAIESLAAEELALLWQDCRLTDQQSAQILEVYLDHRHPTWREDVARGEERMASAPDGRMSVEEAYEILGLSRGATREDVRQAHRELMLRLHPDRGGSTYLAAKINEAKGVLLEKLK
ncbi:MAG: DnaJ domain-containing protein [Hyphomicrobiaceae bacterium]|nr:DnaJ domain-containing protein [Hyphomicrobiaceae bacterium]